MSAKEYAINLNPHCFDEPLGCIHSRQMECNQFCLFATLTLGDNMYFMFSFSSHFSYLQHSWGVIPRHLEKLIFCRLHCFFCIAYVAFAVALFTAMV